MQYLSFVLNMYYPKLQSIKVIMRTQSCLIYKSMTISVAPVCVQISAISNLKMSKVLLQKIQRYLLEDGEFIEEEETEILQVSFILMRLVRLSPKKGQRLTPKDLVVFCLILTPIIVVDSLANMIKQYVYPEQFILDDILQNFTTVVSGTNLYIILAMFIYKNQDIVDLVRKIGDFREFRKPVSFDRANRIANTVAILDGIYNCIGLSGYALTSYLQRTKCFHENEALKVERVCGVLSPSVLPYYFNDEPYIYLIFGGQTFNVTVLVLAAATVYTLTFGIVLVISSRIRQLGVDVQDALNCTNQQLRKKRLKHCVRHHMYILEIVGDLNRCIAWPTFFQSASTSSAIGVISIQFLLHPGIKSALHGFGWVIALYIFCLGGQILIDESNKIPMYVYDTDWFEYDVETQKCVLMIIQRADHSLYLDTVMFGPLSFTTFSNVMQNAYSIIAMIY